MKHLLWTAFTLLMITSCQKQSIPLTAHEKIFMLLKDRMTKTDLSILDIKNSITYSIPEADIIRIPIKGKEGKQDFFLFSTEDAAGGRFIHIEGSINEHQQFNGHATIQDIQRDTLVHSSIINGFIQGMLTTDQLQKAQVQPNIITLPEVIVVASYPSTGISLSEWYQITDLLLAPPLVGGTGTTTGSGSNGGTTSGYYGAGQPSAGAGSTTPVTIKIDYENQYADEAIDIEAYIKCFAAVPDAGATCSIEIFSDIPVDSNPAQLFDFSSGTPGHCFIQLQKKNGSQLVVQNIGFYPKTGWKTVATPAPMAGKFVDNGNHEFNASYKVSITPTQLQTGLVNMSRLARSIQYDIDDNNCTDWALKIFNATVKVSEELKIPLYNIPGGMAPYGTSTPQGLYAKLKEMKAAGGTPAAGITVPVVGWAGSSKGPCQ